MTEQIEPVALHKATQERYLNYALSVITSRALPDVRDGLKPVQRRILYAMFRNLRLLHDAKHRKSAAVVGEVMAKYHPHGDQAIYDAMVRMAQAFSMRYPLVDGQGNFGSLDGDSAAAMRYTEARLRAVASELLLEIQKKTVDFRPNYDGQHFEPEVLPAQLPHLLLNGATGIAVGMATNIPPHNLREIIKACIHMVDNPDAVTSDLMRFVKGPDYPTGGKLLNSQEEILKIYEEGSGSFITAGEYFEEDGPEGEKLVVITSIPYMVNKATLIEKIAEHIRAGSVPQLVDIRDESTEEIRIVLELAPKARAQVAMAYLYKNTPLQHRFHVNMTCLVPTEWGEGMAPARLSLAETLQHFLEFRYETIKRRLFFDLEQLEKRIHLLEAFEKIFADLDEVIRIIRAAENKKAAAVALMARFELDEVQADAVLETKLYKISKLEIEQVRAELAEKRAAAEKLRELLGNPDALWALLKNELKELRTKYGDKRRTVVEGPVEELSFSAEDYIVREDTIVIVTREGWVKRQRSYADLSSIRVREHDEVGWVFHTQTHQTVILFTNKGRAYTLLADSIPATSGYGDPIQASFDFSDGEKIVGAFTSDINCSPYKVHSAFDLGEHEGPVVPGSLPVHMVAITRGGNGLRFPIDAYTSTSTRSGRLFVKFKGSAPNGEPDGVVRVMPSNGTENVCLATYQGRGSVFRASDLTEVKGRGRGVTAVKLDKKDSVLMFTLSTDRLEGLEVETSRGRHEVVRTTKFPVSKRGNLGRPIILRGFIARATLHPEVAKPPEDIDPEVLQKAQEDAKKRKEVAEAQAAKEREIAREAAAKRAAAREARRAERQAAMAFQESLRMEEATNTVFQGLPPEAPPLVVSEHDTHRPSPWILDEEGASVEPVVSDTERVHEAAEIAEVEEIEETQTEQARPEPEDPADPTDPVDPELSVADGETDSTLEAPAVGETKVATRLVPRRRDRLAAIVNHPALTPETESKGAAEDGEQMSLL